MATNTLMKGIESKGSKPSVTDNFGLNKFAELARLAMTMRHELDKLNNRRHLPG